MTNQTSKITATGSGATFKVEPLTEQAEKAVREYWMELYDNPFGGMTGCLRIMIPEIEWNALPFFSGEERWLAAKAYTDQHRRKREELEYQLSLQKLLVANMDAVPQDQRNSHDHDADRNALQRTADMLQQALSAHMRGVRETAKC